MPRFLINLKTNRLIGWSPVKAKYNHLSPISDEEAEAMIRVNKLKAKNRAIARTAVHANTAVDADFEEVTITIPDKTAPTEAVPTLHLVDPAITLPEVTNSDLDLDLGDLDVNPG